MSGIMSEEDMRDFSREYREATDLYAGKKHLVLADMRGLRSSVPEAAAVFGEAIGYARKRGVVCCAHLSDSTIARLQAARLAREFSPGDDVTVDAVSLEEAEKVLAEERKKHFEG